MIRPAQEGDTAAIDAFLAQHAETSMFLRANLAQFGLSGSDDPRATTYWLDDAGDVIRAVYGRSNAGFLMAQAPDTSPDDWAAIGRVLSGQTVTGVTGARDQVDAARAALRLNARDFALDRPEPLYRLALKHLRDPGPAVIRPPNAQDTALLERWMYDYNTEALGAPDNDATRARIKAEVPGVIASGNTRLLIEGGKVVAKTAFNARLPDMVQIGGVYTPPDLRCRGLARKAVAAHLKEARAEGAKTAILFASGEAACRAYEAIGFGQIGEYVLAILAEPLTIGARQ